MDITQGDEAAFTQATVPELLRLMELRREEALASEREAFQAQQDALREQYAAEAKRRKDAEQATVRAQAESEAREVNRRKAIRSWAERWARWLVRIATGLIAACFAVITAVTVLPLNAVLVHAPGPLRLAISLISFAIAVISAIGASTGFFVGRLIDGFVPRLADWLEGLLLKMTAA